MSYIIQSDNPFASTKLTEAGREKLAKGKLNFVSWAIGDSEINYDREFLLDETTVSGSSIILRPKDKQPGLKYYITKDGSTLNYSFNSSDIKCIKALVVNEAKTRGTFSGTFGNYTTRVSDISNYVRYSNTITNVAGGTNITLTGSGVEEGDFILLKIGYSDLSNTTPQPHLWFKVQSVAGEVATVDRTLPNVNTTNVTYVLYKGGELYNNGPTSMSYWDTGTLEFNSSCDITSDDVPLWNMNNTYSDDLMGIPNLNDYETYIDYGSYDYVGQKDNYLYTDDGSYDPSLMILHYTNKTISNLYGEYIYVDQNNKILKVQMPDLMYHRRDFGGSKLGDEMGMTFISDSELKSEGINNLNYYDLIEDKTLIASSDNPVTVGRVYPDLKIITFHDQEIVAANSYKSNRNWTLPKMKLTAVNPTGDGALASNSTIYVSYTLENTGVNGIKEPLPCQNITSYTNNTSNTKDIQFTIEDTDLFPYMRDNSTSGGFYATDFKVIYQIVTAGDKPTSDNWKFINFTSSVINGSYVDANQLEVQNPLAATPSFVLTSTNTASSTPLDLANTLTLPTSQQPDVLQFGDERMFNGNIEAYIGATIYKTLFRVNINSSEFTYTTNTTRSNNNLENPPTIRVSDIGIYDSDGDLVIISKLSNPISLVSGSNVMVELSIDF